ncbi:hypothetical protein MOQ_007275 [Trypanosoma cruzi marinkellei]|uniref:Uncharacterized protein n=1 Tax=Trypanosoma cruzi marinkellei TaxID=85056 RepID=K2N2Y6_TRYCR|nr:hypothetical protein MOQ_007275 [Trypanosoma cruzi marinkellei]
MGNTCAPQKGPRFKNFVIAVYPDDPHNGPVREALGKLQNYIASNPERIPRVCRKISKLLTIYLKRQKVQRVMVGVLMLRDLIAHSEDVSGFVPHCISICSMLFSYSTVEYRVGAADVLTILCYKLAGRVDGEHSCRLLTDSKGKLLPALENMCLETVSNDDAATLRCRYAAVVALGNVIFCLNGALTNNVNCHIMPFLRNLMDAMRGGDKSEWIEREPFTVLQQHIKNGPFDSVTLPAEQRQRDIACISAASWGIGAVAGCVSIAGIHQFLQIALEFIVSHDGWSLPGFPSITFRSLARALEWRPQQLGFTVCQYLCEIVIAPRKKEEAAAKMQEGIIRALIVCTNEVRMTGGRPQVLFEVIQKCMNKGKRTDDFNELLLQLLTTLMYTTHKWRNAPQLHLLLVGLLACAQEAISNNAVWVLRALAVAAAYVRAVPLVDRGDIDLSGTIEPFLATHNALQAYAAQVLVGLIAGTIPSQDVDVGSNFPDAETVTAEAPPPLVTNEQDMAVAENWVWSVLASTQPVTPSCVIEVGRVVEAVMKVRGASSLPFVLSFVSRLQAFVGNEKKTSELHMAWAHLSLVVLANCGAILTLPHLLRYAVHLFQQRRHGNELARQFEFRLTEESVGPLQLARGGNAADELLCAQPANCPPVTVLIAFDTVADIIAEDADAEVYTVFSTQRKDELKAVISGACFKMDAADASTPPLPSRVRARARRLFSLEPLCPSRVVSASIAVSVVDGVSTAATAASGDTSVAAASFLKREPLMGKPKNCIADLLARHGVAATTHLVHASARAATLTTAIEKRGKIMEAKEKEEGGNNVSADASKASAVYSRNSSGGIDSSWKSHATSNVPSSLCKLDPPVANHAFFAGSDGFNVEKTLIVEGTDAVKSRIHVPGAFGTYRGMQKVAGRTCNGHAVRENGPAAASGGNRSTSNYVDLL